MINKKTTNEITKTNEIDRIVDLMVDSKFGIDDILLVKSALEEAERHKFHDLKKDPNDLPEVFKQYLVLVNGFWGTKYFVAMYDGDWGFTSFIYVNGTKFEVLGWKEI